MTTYTTLEQPANKMEAAAPLIQKVFPLPVPPFLLNQKFYDALAEAPSLDKVVLPIRASTVRPNYVSEADRLPAASWTFARKQTSSEKLPQAIAHRGYKAKHPENTMGAFRGAVNANAHAIETDVHLTKDDVVVLSHASTIYALARC